MEGPQRHRQVDLGLLRHSGPPWRGARRAGSAACARSKSSKDLRLGAAQKRVRGADPSFPPEEDVGAVSGGRGRWSINPESRMRNKKFPCEGSSTATTPSGLKAPESPRTWTLAYAAPSRGSQQPAITTIPPGAPPN